MFTTSVLLILALLAAIVGTYWDSTSRVKMFLVIIAALSCGGAMFQSYQANQESEFNKRVMEHLIRATEPPEIFTSFLRSGVRELAERNNLWMHQQEKTRKNIAIFFLAREQDEPGEADIIILLREATFENIFLSYISGVAVADAIEMSLNTQWGGGNPKKNWNDFVGVLTDLVTLTATYHPQWKDQKFKVNSKYVRERQYVNIVVYSESTDSYSTVVFKQQDIQKILAENLLFRDQSVFNYATLKLSVVNSGLSTSGLL